MKSDGAGDESSALRRHQAVGAYRRWNPPSFDAPPPPPPPDPEEEAAQAEAREHERRRQQKAAAMQAAAAEKRRRQQEEQAERERAEQEAAQQRAVEAAIAEQKRLLEEQMLAQQRQWPTAEEIEQVYENARKEGFETGHAEGHAQGLREGFASGEAQAREQLNAQADVLAQAIASLDVALAEIDQQVADELIALAVELARKMCLHSISRPENVRALVQDALQQVPQKHVQIHLHPQDAAHVRARLLEGLDETQQRIVEDDTLTPGGCILLGDGTHLDASVQTRWRRILGEVGFSGHEAQWELGEEEPVSEDEAAPPPPPETAAPQATADAPAPAEAAAAEMPAPETTAQPTDEPAPAAGASAGAQVDEAAQRPPEPRSGDVGGALKQMTDAQSAAGVSVGASPPAASVGAHNAPQ